MVLRFGWILDAARDLLSPVSCVQEYLHPRELILLGIALLSSVTVLCIGLYECGDESLEELQRWSTQHWVRAECKVLQQGVAYLGDCDARLSATVRNWHAIPFYNYTECPIKLPEHCHNELRRAYKTGITRRLLGRTSGGGASAEAGAGAGAGAGGDDGSAAAAAAAVAAWRERPEDAAAPEPRELNDRRFAQVCRDSFLAWVHVEVKGAPREACGYRTGLYRHSQVLSVEEAVDQLIGFERGLNFPCWLLTLKSVGLVSLHSCHLVAFDNPDTWTQGTALARDRVIRKVLLWLSIGCASVAGVAAAVQRWCWRQGVESWSDLLICQNPFTNEQLQLEADSERVRFVRDRWRLFRANVLAEYQPVSSARDCVSSDLSGERDASAAG